MFTSVYNVARMNSSPLAASNKFQESAIPANVFE